MISKPLISGKNSTNGVESESTKKLFNNLSARMFMAGFGAEYFLSENFSIGGEFGLRMFLINYQDETTELVQTYNSQTGTYNNYNTNHKYTFDLGIGLTYSSLVLNYYF